MDAEHANLQNLFKQLANVDQGSLDEYVGRSNTVAERVFRDLQNLDSICYGVFALYLEYALSVGNQLSSLRAALERVDAMSLDQRVKVPLQLKLQTCIVSHNSQHSLLQALAVKAAKCFMALRHPAVVGPFVVNRPKKSELKGTGPENLAKTLASTVLSEVPPLKVATAAATILDALLDGRKPAPFQLVQREAGKAVGLTEHARNVEGWLKDEMQPFIELLKAERLKYVELLEEITKCYRQAMGQVDSADHADSAAHANKE